MSLKPIIALYNEAGGMGKSTLSRALAEKAAREGRRTLVIDMDPQATLSGWLIGKRAYNANTLLQFYEHGDLPTPISVTLNLDLIPANQALHGATAIIRESVGGNLRLQKALSQLDYDFVVLDTKGTTDPLVESALLAANLVLIPFQATAKGIIGAARAVNTIKELARFSNIPDLLLGIVPTMVDRRVKADHEAVEAAKAIAPVFPMIPYRPALFRRAEVGQLLSDPLDEAIDAIYTEVMRRRA